MLERKASIIIPTGHRPGALSECLRSLGRLAQENEVIVIGEKEDHPTRRIISENFPSIKYLEADQSSAVAKRNLGIAEASNEILVFIDDDVVIGDGWLAMLLMHYEDPSVGGVGGRVRILVRGSESRTYGTGVVKDGFVIANWDVESASAFEVEHLPGCNMSFRRTLVLQVHGFDNVFRSFNFREETDLCFRVRKLGYRLIFEPRGSLTHLALGQRSTGLRWTYFYVRNTLYLYLKYQFHRGFSLTRFLKYLFFPPKEYVIHSGVRVKVSPLTPLVATAGLVAGFLGYLADERGEPALDAR
jgi:GT2 family glycosyltransferase